MPNAGPALSEYLEARQHLWNVYFRPKVHDLRNVILDDFEQIDFLLFKSIVCSELGILLPDKFVLGQDCVPDIKVMPKSAVDETLVMTEKDFNNGTQTWNAPAVVAVRGLKLNFIDFFQWDHYGVLSMAHVLCRTSPSSQHQIAPNSLIVVEKKDFDFLV
ncbi:hypothetical protein [Aestuariivirga sp.]|uniref:hypothetical protein n=1 Tax=Aestuariivirga sp. TaxID=2650926 RepID=UPI0039E38D2B